MSLFIGGDTEEVNYNFSTKVAGSTVECPLKIYNSIAAEQKLPSDQIQDSTKGWSTVDTELIQERLDKLKYQNGQYPYLSVKSSKDKHWLSKFMVEVDLNPLCDSKFGGSHEALKNAIRDINIDVWASGSGDNNGSVGHKCNLHVWSYSGNDQVWNPKEWYGSSVSTKQNVSKLNIHEPTHAPYRIDWNNNKIYILIASGYPSSATIPSTLNLDYIDVKLTLARTPDVLMFTDSEGNKKNYLDVNLSDEWSVLLKGVSPAWDSNNWNYNDFGGITVASKNGLDSIVLLETSVSSEKRFRVVIKDNGKLNDPISFHKNFNKFQCLNYLFQKKKNKLIIYMLFNNQIIEKKEYKINRENFMTGECRIGFYALNAFLERFNFFDYAIANTNNEAEVILKGRNEIDVNNNRLNELGKQFENPNLCPDFKDKNWIHQSDYSVSEDGKTLTINPTEPYKGSFIVIPVLPNNKYKVKCSLSKKSQYIGVEERYNNINSKTGYKVLDFDDSSLDGTFITKKNTNNIIVACNSRQSGNFIFNNVELRRLD